MHLLPVLHVVCSDHYVSAPNDDSESSNHNLYSSLD